MGGPRLTPEQKQQKREQRKAMAREKYREDAKNPEFLKLLAERQRRAYHANVLIKRQKRRERRNENLEAYRAKAREAYRKEVQSPDGRIKRALRRGIQRMVEAGATKNGTSQHLVGASFAFVRTHIEQMWAMGMSWENYGLWHIDHIKPLSSFNLSDPEELSKAAHYTNLQPVWAKVNLSWGAKR